jgi:hypothetical protein
MSIVLNSRQFLCDAVFFIVNHLSCAWWTGQTEARRGILGSCPLIASDDVGFEKASLEWCRGNSKVWENPVRENTTHYTVGYTCKVVLRSYLALGCEVT